MGREGKLGDTHVLRIVWVKTIATEKMEKGYLCSHEYPEPRAPVGTLDEGGWECHFLAFTHKMYMKLWGFLCSHKMEYGEETGKGKIQNTVIKLCLRTTDDSSGEVAYSIVCIQKAIWSLTGVWCRLNLTSGICHHLLMHLVACILSNENVKA